MRYLQIVHSVTGEVASRYDVTHRSERELEKLERGLLMKIDAEAGWFVDDVTEQPAA